MPQRLPPLREASRRRRIIVIPALLYLGRRGPKGKRLPLRSLSDDAALSTIDYSILARRRLLTVARISSTVS